MKLTVFTEKSTGKITQYWSKCVGSGHAALSLREDWRKQLKKCREELGFEYVRFHGLFNDDMSVCKKRFDGIPEYSFYNIDSTFDFLLEIGMKPFVELSFMPEALASGSRTVFHYKGNITPPKSYDEWGDLVGALVKHLVERYGIEEVRKWFFEVWNEPNLDIFWSGNMDDYFELYRHAAQAIKKVDSEIPVGGPATAIDAWIPELREFCRQNNLPLDFITTHHYPTDAAYGLGLDMEEQMARAGRGVLYGKLEKALGEAYPLPVYYTEWNNSPSPRDPYHDIPYNAAFIVKTVTENLKLEKIDQLKCYSFWTFSDIFEESGFSSIPFHGGFGLLNIHGIPKPSYRAFQLLSQLKGDKLEVSAEEGSATVECAASKNSEGITILLSNHQIPKSPIEAEKVSISVNGIKGVKSAVLRRIDEDHANPKKAWLEMGAPAYLNNDQIQKLVEASEMTDETIDFSIDENGARAEVLIQPHSVIAIRLIPEK